MKSCYNSHLPSIKLLIQFESSLLSEEDEEKRSPLFYASHLASFECFLFLIKQGASLFQTDIHGLLSSTLSSIPFQLLNFYPFSTFKLLSLFNFYNFHPFSTCSNFSHSIWYQGYTPLHILAMRNRLDFLLKLPPSELFSVSKLFSSFQSAENDLKGKNGKKGQEIEDKEIEEEQIEDKEIENKEIENGGGKGGLRVKKKMVDGEERVEVGWGGKESKGSKGKGGRFGLFSSDSSHENKMSSFSSLPLSSLSQETIPSSLKTPPNENQRVALSSQFTLQSHSRQFIEGGEQKGVKKEDKIEEIKKEEKREEVRKDKYGFYSVSREEKSGKDKQVKVVEMRREIKWMKMLKNWGEYVVEKKKQEVLKSRVGKGIPDSVRGFAWKKILETEKLREEKTTLYSTLLQNHSIDTLQIKKDLHRTFPNHGSLFPFHFFHYFTHSLPFLSLFHSLSSTLLPLSRNHPFLSPPHTLPNF